MLNELEENEAKERLTGELYLRRFVEPLLADPHRVPHSLDVA
jgi:hypothetical protein